MQKQQQQSKRSYCPRCHYPITTCLCSAITPIASQSQLTILQHFSEQTSAKNTAKLLPLAIPSTVTFIGESAEDFADAKQHIAHSPLPVRVVYPAEHAIELEPTDAQHNGPFHFVLIDGTWKKAYKIWQLNPWLHALPCIRITNVTSDYRIRKAPAKHCLSTLEAAAYCLTCTEGIDCAPLIRLFNARQQTFLQHQNQQQ